MTTKDKKKKNSIYDLYTREKLVTFTDDAGKTSDILFVKMTQGDLTETLQIYNRETMSERKRIQDD